MTPRTAKTVFLAASLAVAGCNAVSLDPVRADRRALEQTGDGGSGGASSSDGGSSATGGFGGSVAITPQPSIAFHGAALPPDHTPGRLNGQWSDLVPTDPNVYLLVGTAGMTCAAPYAFGVSDCDTPAIDEMIIEVPLALQHAGAFDLRTVRTNGIAMNPTNGVPCSGVNWRVNSHPSGTVVILAIDEQNVRFDLVGNAIDLDPGSLSFDGEYATTFCP